MCDDSEPQILSGNMEQALLVITRLYGSRFDSSEVATLAQRCTSLVQIAAVLKLATENELCIDNAFMSYHELRVQDYNS